MIEDVKTMAWKEYKELLSKQGNFKGGLFGLLLQLAIFGIYLPLTMGRGFVETPYILIFWVWFPMLLVIGVVVDSFAGERERHTLETLLASRLSDRAILGGKILAAVAYGWAMTVIFIALGLISVNAANWDGQVLMFEPLTLAFILLAALLVGVVVAAAGVLVSLRAPTVRQASQALSIGIFAVAAVPFIAFFVLPDEWKKQVLDALLNLGMAQGALAVLAVLIVVSLILLYAAMLRFRRNRLILD